MFPAPLVRWLGWAGLLGLAALTPARVVADQKPLLRPLVEIMEKAVSAGEVVGAQIVVGGRTSVLLNRNLGRLAPGSSTPVNEDTLFCIGSCSKPVAATCVLALVDQKTLGLDTPVGKWLPAFRGLQVEGGAAARRAPTLGELLAHRGGIYSQRDDLTREQHRAIRDYTLTLEDSVQLIARQKLLWQPGSKNAYSGAGYCVLGRVAEVAANKPFEAIFQQALARPLGLERATYFPGRHEKNIAVGGRKRAGRIEADSLAPHLQGAAHRLPLIGGSLYATARDIAAFARPFLDEGRVAGKQVLSTAAWRESTRRQYAGQDYGLGWVVGGSRGGKQRAQTLFHNGALASYRSVLHIDLAGGHFLVAHWTLADRAAKDKGQRLAKQLNKAWHAAAPQLKK
jgi:CubicO group peptidase (beta-lactamase class C family)